MYKMDERLPDWAYTENELDEMALGRLENTKMRMAGHLVMYHMYKDGVDTGIVMLLAVDSISDGLHAINRYWGQHGMYAEIGEFGEEEDPAVIYKFKALEIVLEKFKYEGKIKCPGSEKLYRYREWFGELV